MTKITEALKLAEEALNAMLTHMGMDEDEWTKPTFNQAREALAAIREASADHVANVGKMVAEPVKQEPVAHYKDAPHTIYLQTGCDDPEDCECSFNEWGDTTWCADQIHDTDIPYIRADYAAPVSAKRERYFCERCGKRVGDNNGAWEGVHTCTPPEDTRRLK